MRVDRRIQTTARSILTTAGALAIGTAGGALFVYLRLPLPWLLGSFAGTLVVAVTVGGINIDTRLRRLVLPILGVLIGASFDPEILGQLARWPAGIAAASTFTAIATVLGYLYFAYVARWDKPTALYASPPGGLAEMLAIGSEMGADERRMILTHSIRIALVVVLATLAIRFYFHADAATLGRTRVAGSTGGIGLTDALILGACAVVGGVLGTRLRLPGGIIFGALVLSAVVHISGISHVSPPTWIVAAAQVVLGAGLGVRFRGISRGEVAAVVTHATVWGLVLLVLALTCGVLLGPIIEFDPRGLFLGFAPGGFTEMMLVALAIGIESAFVATCHAFRLIVIFFCVPVAGVILKRAWDRAATEAD